MLHWKSRIAYYCQAPRGCTLEVKVALHGWHQAFGLQMEYNSSKS